MKIYSKIVIDIATGRVLECESDEYTGPVALAGGGGKASKPEENRASKIVGGVQGPLTGRLENILGAPGDDPYFQRQAELGTQKIRSGYGARGLAGSGISVQGEQDFLKDLTLGRNEAQDTKAIQILGAASGTPVFGPQPVPRGFMGLK